MRMREMITTVNQLVTRLREAHNKLKSAGNEPEKLNNLNVVATKLLSEPVRYGKPGLQAHITYLSNMTANVDQKIGRDAVERYTVLKKELDDLKTEVEKILGASIVSGTATTPPEY